MEYVSLGRTGIETSVAGLGCGGPSRLGMSRGASEADAAEVVRRALDLGVTFIDSSEAYGTEGAVGKGIAGHRDEVVLCTKAITRREGRPLGAQELRASLEGSLRRLGTDYIDVYLLHAVVAEHYDHVVGELLPALESLRAEGAIRAVGVSEAFARDPGHRMLARAVEDPWEVVMVGFNLLNQSARDRVLARTRERGIGTLDMFAVRRALRDPVELARVVQELREEGAIDDPHLDPANPLGFLFHPEGAASLTEAAYRFCRHEPGIDVVLTGTGDVGHLAENVGAITAPPLPPDDAERLRRLFARVDHISGN